MVVFLLHVVWFFLNCQLLERLKTLLKTAKTLFWILWQFRSYRKHFQTLLLLPLLLIFLVIRTVYFIYSILDVKPFSSLGVEIFLFVIKNIVFYIEFIMDEIHYLLYVHNVNKFLFTFQHLLSLLYLKSRELTIYLHWQFQFKIFAKCKEFCKEFSGIP